MPPFDLRLYTVLRHTEKRLQRRTVRRPRVTPEREVGGTVASKAVPGGQNWLDSWLKYAALPLTVVTLLLTLLGYGYDFGYLEAFGLRPEDLQRTPLDFLLRSYKGLLVWVAMSDQVWTWDYQWDFFQSKVLRVSAPVLTLAASVSVAWYLLIAWHAESGPVSRVKTYWTRMRLESLSRPVWLRAVGYGMPTMLLVLCCIAPFVISLVIWLAGQMIFLAAAIVPVGPAEQAKRNAFSQVVDPRQCSSVNAAGHATTGAKCIRVVKSGCEVQRGRYIEQSATRVWLLKKNPWSVVSVPLDGAVMESIADERPDPGCAGQP